MSELLGQDWNKPWSDILDRMKAASMAMQDALNSRDFDAVEAAAAEMALIEEIMDEMEYPYDEYEEVQR